MAWCFNKIVPNMELFGNALFVTKLSKEKVWWLSMLRHSMCKDFHNPALHALKYSSPEQVLGLIYIIFIETNKVCCAWIPNVHFSFLWAQNSSQYNIYKTGQNDLSLILRSHDQASFINALHVMTLICVQRFSHFCPHCERVQIET